MASRKKRRQRRRTNTRISQHQKKGKRLTPPLAAMPNLQMHNWLEDTLPELLWPLVLVSTADHDGMLTYCAAVDTIAGVIDSNTSVDRPDGLVVDGSLSSLEAVPANARSAILAALYDEDIYERAVPEGFAHALGMYPSAPGRWVIEGWVQRGLSIDPAAAQRFLAPVISDSSHGQERVATRAKFLVVRCWFKRGEFVPIDPKRTAELFSRYPERVTEDERRHLEPEVRSQFGAIWNRHLLSDTAPARDKEWPSRFWRSNWSIYPCESAEDRAVPGAKGDDVLAAVAQLTGEVDALHRRFLRTATTADPDLYRPDRYEILTGIVSRAIRLSAAASRIPFQWSGEYGSPVLRAALESLIVFRYLILKDDADLYATFKSFGRGHLKAQKLHLEEYIDAHDDAPHDLTELLQHLDALVNQDEWEEWQEIDLGGTFSGKDMRKMAAAVRMEDEYKLLLAPASSMTHGEWTALDRYALTRCLNPLHRWHRIPRESPAAAIEPSLIAIVIDFAGDLVDEYEKAFAIGVAEERASG